MRARVWFVLAAAVLGCRDSTEPLVQPLVPGRYALQSINAVPLPCAFPGDTIRATYGEVSVFCADSCTYVWSALSPRNSWGLAGDQGVLVRTDTAGVYEAVSTEVMSCWSPSFPQCHPYGRMTLRNTDPTHVLLTTTAFTLRFELLPDGGVLR